MTNYQKRLQQLQALLQDIPCDALLVEDPINLYYLTGLQLSTGTLIVLSTGGFLLVDGRYYELSKKVSPVPVVLLNQNAFVDLFLKECSQVRVLAFNSELTTYRRYLDLEKCLESVSQKSEGKQKISFIPCESPVKKLRAIKDSDEIAFLRDAGKLGSQGFDFVCSILQEGITEEKVAAELEIFWKQRGSKALAFDPIIAFGANSSMPHYRAGKAQLKTGDTVLIDIGVNYQHYHSDMTRVLFFKEANPKILEIYEVVKEAQRAALEICRPGTLIADLDRAARKVISSHGYGEHFTHSLGHGVGLEIHEWPTLRDAPPFQEIPLKAGMVITIEPGIYLSGIGGVRLEDTIVITANGYENLTNRPIEPIVI